MMTNLQKEIQQVFKKFPEFWEEETLLKSKIIENIRNYEPNLLAALLANSTIKEAYTIEIDGNYIFKSEEFISMLRYKNYLENSYTKYSNQIGLASDDKYLDYSSDVVLNFPHKDGVFEGGMTKEDLGKNEVFYHNILAKEEIDTLFSSKILKNIKKYDAKGNHSVSEFLSSDNLIIKGNNLIALHTLKSEFTGKIELIYIDPPFNTGNDSFKYNDNFNRSTWLTFMKNRLDIAKKLLSDTGLIWVNLDDNEAHYCKVLLDQIFGEENLIADVIWQSRKSVSNDAMISSNTNHLLCYANNKSSIKRESFRLPLDEDNYKYYDEEVGEHYRIAPFDAPEIRKNLEYKIVNPNTEEEYFPPKGRHWITTENEYQNLLKNKKIKFGTTGTARPQLKVFLSEDLERGAGKTTTTLWNDLTTTTNATQALRKLELSFNFNNPKPEELLERIMYLSTNENDIVLDFFMGSATTQAVAMKMNRQFIGIEQMDYINTVSVPRLQKVIEGEQGGISKDVGWEGGGSFVYAELYELNQVYIDEIQAATDQEAIRNVLESIQTSDFLNLKVDLDKVFNKNDEFFELTLAEQKAILIQVLDNNQLYLSYSEIDDDQYAIDEDTKAFNASFYNEEV